MSTDIAQRLRIGIEAGAIDLADIMDAADEIERLRDATHSTSWIAVGERLPATDCIGNSVGVLVCLPDGERGIGFCTNDEYGVRWDCQSTKKPTHWMPLPEPPEAIQ